MRFLHTADWHLGRQIRGKSRAAELEAVLIEIANIAVEERVDAVLIAGDIWDSASPAAEADRLLFDMLRRLVKQDIEVVMVSGNHDNPRKLEGIGRLSEMLNVQTRGFIRPPQQGGIVKIERGGECAEIAAIPWVPEGRALDGVELLNEEFKTRGIYEDSVEEIYSQLAQGFTPGAIHLMLGHLFVDGALLASVDGSERRLHIEQAYGINASRLPSTPQYIALGHIHQPQVIVDAPNGAAAYAGSIVQLDFGEIGQQKVVRILDAIPERPVEHRDVSLTAGRQLIELRGSVTDVLEAGKSIGDDHVRVVLDVSTPEAGLVQRIRDSLPGVVDVRLDYDRSEDSETEVDFADLAPEQLFIRYYLSHHGAEPTEEILRLFRELVNEAVSTK